MTMIQTQQTHCSRGQVGFDAPVESTQGSTDAHAHQQACNMSRDEIEQFQYRHGLPRTGEADSKTLKVIAEAAAKFTETEACDDMVEVHDTTKVSKDELYRNNPTTLRAQRALNEVFAHDKPLELDGIRGASTTARIEKFQTLRGLGVTGCLNAETRRALFEEPPLPADPLSDIQKLQQQVQVTVRRVPRAEIDCQPSKSKTEPVSIPARWTDAIDTSHDGALQLVTNIGAGLGDSVSYGLTNVVRTAIGGNESVNKDTVSYGGGSVAGQVVRTYLEWQLPVKLPIKR